MTYRRWRNRVVVVGVALAMLGSLYAEGELKRGEDLVHAPAIAEGLCVHNLFQSNMVLQRDKPIRIRGWAAPGESVTVRFAGQEQTTAAANDRSWSVELTPMPVNSEPQEMTVKGTDTTLKLENILIGDVWVLGGQSNMEFPLERIENGPLEVASAHFQNIRILTVPTMNGAEERNSFARLHEWSDWSKRHFRKGDWDVCSPENVRELSAIGYVFARRIHMASQVPIGVIDVSRGGTTVETWTPDSELRTIDTPEVKDLLTEWDTKVAAFDPQADLDARIKKHHEWVETMKRQGKEIPADRQVPSDLRPGPAMDQNRPGNCYASMLAPIAGLAVKGAIFHQGYNNCFKGTAGAMMYAQVFPKMIAAWRAAFNDPAMAFGIISLCTQGSPQTRDDFLAHMADAGPYIREAQYKTFLDLYRAGDKNIGFVSSYDLRRRWYHPQLKVPAGERIARWALATQYGLEKQIRWKPPMINEMKVEEGRIVLEMDESVGGVDDGGPMVGFAVAGKDRRYQPAEVNHLVTGKDSRGRPQKDLKVLVLTSAMVPELIHYRYAWARSPMGNIQAHFNTDIPLATQRSDDWRMLETPVTFGEPSDREAMNELRKSLRMEDMRRRLTEARELIETQGETFEKELADWKLKWEQ